jgi:hypothetical protein
MALYDAVGNRLAYTLPVAVTAAGLVSCPLVTMYPLIGGRTYQIGVVTNLASFTFGVDSSATGFTYKTAGTYPTPPATLGGQTATTYGSPVFYADGFTTYNTIGTSGTVSITQWRTGDCIQRAVNRCRIHSGRLTDEILDKAHKELYMLLSSIPNRGDGPLWSRDWVLVPMTQGLVGTPMPAGTIDVLKANYRTMNPLQSSTVASYSPSSATQCTTVGITWSGPAVPILITQTAGSTTTTLVTATPDATTGQTTLFDLDGSYPANLYTVSTQSGSTLPASQVSFYATLSEIPMYPMSDDEYSWLPNISFPGSPRQYWLDRQLSPVMKLWPAPQLLDQTQACLRIRRKRNIMDVGNLTQIVEVPQHWYEAITDALAVRIAKVVPEVDITILPSLQQDAIISMNAAVGENRERGAMKIIPNIVAYTR